jgi:predicted Fe-Mo cluster-binding NifX family protein
MRIAIPVENGRLNSHFGGSTLFAIVEVDPNTNATLRTETLPAPEHQPGAFPVWLQRLGVQNVIVGGIGKRALTLFAQHGITVRAGQPNASVEVLVAAYLAGQLVDTRAGCEHHGHHHEHDHDHHHHHHHHHHHGGVGEITLVTAKTQ